MSGEWAVHLELVSEQQISLERNALDRLIEQLAQYNPALMHCAGRYALLLHISASTALEAHFSALLHWQDALRGTPTADWRVVRAEILTAEEFERDCASEERSREWARESRREVSVSRVGEDLLRAVFVDPLTRLPTIEAFRAGLDQVLNVAPRAGRHHAVLVLDLEPNSALVQEADELEELVLLRVVERLTALTRPTDTIARVGAETFAVLVRDVRRDDVMALGARTLQAMTSATATAGPGTPAGGVGIALSVPASDAESLLYAAQAAASAAKGEGGRRCVLSSTPVPAPGASKGDFSFRPGSDDAG